MNAPDFTAPSLETLAALLPAYDFESFIAQGGMGAVYKARQRSLDRVVAIKVLPRELGEDSEFRQSFVTEARAMARLNHPNLIGVYDSGDLEGQPYIVMEYVDGQSLYHSSYGIKVEPEQAVTIIKGVCDGLAHAHDHGIIHRDIKPANILLTQRAEPKIGDFGLARPAGLGDTPGFVMGTPGYLAPEVMAHPERADQRSDLFAVGVMLYQLLTGHLPEAAPPPPSRSSSCGPLLDQICLKAVHPNPAFRYQDAASMAAALQGWLEKSSAAAGGVKLAIGPAPARALRPPSRPLTQTPGAFMGARPSVTRKKSNSTRNVLLIGCLGIAAVAAIVISLGGSKRDRSPGEAKITVPRPSPIASADAISAVPELPAAAVGSEQPEAAETPLESLSRLKPALAEGIRTELPVGAQSRMGSHFLFVSTAMTWHEAAAFAAQHGGHLACPQTETDATWLAEQVPNQDESMAWVGAGRAGRDGWSLVDGSGWSLITQPTGDGAHAAITHLGMLRARKPLERLPFFIQWRADGENPGALEQILVRTRQSLTESAPVFPPGTLAYGSRNFLIVPGNISHSQAASLAEQAGGHLACLASRGETEWLAEQLQEWRSGTAFWIGGSRQAGGWQWTTGEPWENPSWAEGEPQADGERLAVAAGSGWRSVSAGQQVDGFVVEWSADSEAAP